jgi:hypothetical protein
MVEEYTDGVEMRLNYNAIMFIYIYAAEHAVA